ncbi:MAG: hypothetical protein CME93_06875 [Hyphomonadaceae bacterium]|nr:hypothetical protein [Hyphomonadaceae bacterium]OUX93673.1 MAG: hypothetical protein CBB77_08350 [Hyphomonas sp. TMED17]
MRAVWFKAICVAGLLSVTSCDGVSTNLSKSQTQPNDVYKIMTLEQWETATQTGSLTTDFDRNDGFVHLSASRQLAGTLARFFADEEQLVLIQVDESKLGSELVWEAPYPNDGRGGVFPHYYGDLLLSQSTEYWEIERGAFDLPLTVLNQSEE